MRSLGKREASQDVVIRPDLEKLDLSVRDFINLDELSASDSGRTVGPKAAKLGELRKHFPEAVSPGVAIPFGVFREVVLDQPYRQTKQTVFEWMVENYRNMRKAAGRLGANASRPQSASVPSCMT